MYGDMTSIPSMTVLKLIEKARQCPNQTSVQLQETLENAGIINPKKGREFHLSEILQNPFLLLRILVYILIEFSKVISLELYLHALDWKIRYDMFHIKLYDMFLYGIR